MKLNENQVRAIVKKTSDALEKLSIASLAVGIFQNTLQFHLLWCWLMDAEL